MESREVEPSLEVIWTSDDVPRLRAALELARTCRTVEEPLLDEVDLVLDELAHGELTEFPRGGVFDLISTVTTNLFALQEWEVEWGEDGELAEARCVFHADPRMVGRMITRLWTPTPVTRYGAFRERRPRSTPRRRGTRTRSPPRCARARLSSDDDPHEHDLARAEAVS
jgi:hypothetical protein